MKKHRIIHIKIWRGLVESVRGLPRDWTYEVVDFDDLGSDQGELRMAKINKENKNLGIAVKSGIVWEIGKLPKGYKYRTSEYLTTDVGKQIKGGHKMKKRRAELNPMSILPWVGILTVGGIAIYFIFRKKGGGTTTGKKEFTQAEIAALYKDWVTHHKTNPSAATNWLNTILKGATNAITIVNYFNGQGGSIPGLQS